MLKRLALDRIFHALSDPNRRWIVEVLCDGEASVSWIAEPLPIDLSTILEHLKVLENGGLIATQKTGRVRTCRIEPESLHILDEWLRRQRPVRDSRLPRLRL